MGENIRSALARFSSLAIVPQSSSSSESVRLERSYQSPSPWFTYDAGDFQARAAKPAFVGCSSCGTLGEECQDDELVGGRHL